jgi:hypothetical protein
MDLRWTSILLVATLGACSSMPPAQEPDGGVTPESTSADLAPAAAPVRYQSDIQPIWEQYCGMCHIDGTRRPRLAASVSYDALVGATAASCSDGRPAVPLVVPGHPEQSYLLYAVGGAQGFGPDTACDPKMPYRDTVLKEQDAAAVDKIARWIADGAQRE